MAVPLSSEFGTHKAVLQKSMGLKYEPSSEPRFPVCSEAVQGYLAHKKTHPPRTLQ